MSFARCFILPLVRWYDGRDCLLFAADLVTRFSPPEMTGVLVCTIAIYQTMNLAVEFLRAIESLIIIISTFFSSCSKILTYIGVMLLRVIKTKFKLVTRILYFRGKVDNVIEKCINQNRTLELFCVRNNRSFDHNVVGFQVSCNCFLILIVKKYFLFYFF